MNKEKEQALDEAFEKFMEMSLMHMHIPEDADQVIAKDVMGYGTTLDEVVDSFTDWKEMIQLQKEQGTELDFSFNRIPYHKRISEREDTALIVETIETSIVAEGFKNEFTFRISVLLEYTSSDKWQVIHWHGSIPSDTENDTWHVNEWKKKNELLEKEVQERTAELKAKNRELEIEAILERIRSQVASMQESTDLFDIVVSMRKEFLTLGHEADYFWHMRWLSDSYEMSMTSEDGSRVGMVISVPKFVHEAIPELAKWEKGNEPIYILPLNPKDAWGYIDNMNVHGKYEQADPNAPTEEDIQHIGGLTFIMARTTHGEIGYSLPGVVTDPPADALDTLNRFAGVFDLAYKRFEDLKAAENQRREAQIELALERIRGQVASMRESKELLNIVVNMRSEFVALDQEAHYFWYMRWLEDTYEKAMTSGDGTQIGMVMSLPRKIHGDIPLVANWEKGDDPILVFAMEVDAAVDYIEKMIAWGDFKQLDPQAPTLDDIRHIGGLTFIMARTTHGEIGFSLPGVVPNPPKDALNILLRFAKVFDLAYSRFEDLKNSEMQTRETQIELALERVRSRTMAMQQSNELPEAANILFNEVRKLGIPAWSCGYNILAEDKKSSMCWMSSENEIQTPFRLPLSVHESMIPWYQAIIDEQPFFVYAQGGEDLVEHYRYLGEIPELEPVFKQFEEAGISLPTYQVNHLARFTQGFLLFITYEEVPHAYDIFMRFAKVFEQTYTRFLDLQKAESQARKAQIEVAVERVRAKALAMHNSSQILEVVDTLKSEMLGLEIPGVSAATIYLQEEDGFLRMWDLTSVTKSEKGFQVTLDIKFRLEETDDGFYIRKIWANEKKYFVESQNDKDMAITLEWLRQYNPEEAEIAEKFLEENPVDLLLHPTVRLANGRMSVDILGGELPDEMESIMTKMGAAFDLAYKRFQDLQMAEERAQEAQIELALERVRSRTMGMQKSEELGDVAAVLFNELNLLVDNLWTCGFVLCEENRKEDEWWLSLDTGFIHGFFLPNVGDFAHETLYEGWQKGESFRSVQLEGDDLQGHYDWLMEIPIAKKIFAEMEASGIPRPNWQKLHAAYFKTGYLVIITEVPCEEKEIFERFAQAFDLTYTRFLDLQQKEEQGKKLVEEKLRLEHTLNDLKSTQSQLIQSEKMASLGELTAGIAHEIQNPLNFVNNFSEVSTELIDEMNEELDKGDIEEAKAIGDDLKENLSKINHHGKRAGDIVKGMLQHSRVGSGKKEPTDINELCDEYLRLAYHGLRAKDKSFNATMDTNFDESIEMINIVPQDIGRVILNLITNAFYVVNEKAKQSISDYEPTVSIITKKISPAGGGQGVEKIQISVKDNGNGIPEHIKEKIFQPFFTTKPTGSGTGLGLSLSYDIVKSHGGEIKLQTKENEGSEFIIKLPNSI